MNIDDIVYLDVDSNVGDEVGRGVTGWVDNAVGD